MRIGLVIDRFDAGRGGGEGYVVSLARGLVRKRHDVHVFAQAWAEPIEGIQYHRLPMIPYPRGAKSVSMALWTRDALRFHGLHVVQGFGGVPGVDVHRPGGGAELAWLIQEIRSRPRGLERLATGLSRVVSLKLLISLVVERGLYGPSMLPLVVANSRKVEADLRRFYPRLAQGRVRVIHNGVDLERFHPRNRERARPEVRRALGLPEDVMVILFMAHNFRLKGLECLLEAIGALREAAGRWSLLVVGRGRRGPYERCVQRCGMGQQVLFLDAVSTPEALLGACDILAHPTFYDPFSNVCLEAMASGVPVITTARNGAAELLEHGVSGFVVPEPRDTEALGQGISALMDPARRGRMGQEARRVAEGFSWDHHIEGMEGLYREVLAMKPGAGTPARTAG